MKKLLLSMAAAALAFTAGATDYVFSTVGTSDWTVDEAAKTLSGTIKADNGSEFKVVLNQNTSTTAITSSSLKSDDLIKWYKNYTMQITAPTGVSIKQIAITASANNYSYEFTGATGATCTKEGTTITYIDKNGGNVFEGTAANGQIRIKSMVISDVAGEAPVVETAKVKLATSISDGQYAIYIPGQGAVAPINDSFGYLYPEAVTVENDSFETAKKNLFTFKSETNGYTIVDANGKYVGMDATHKSFNMYASADAEGSNCYWTVEFEGNNVKISNVGRTGFYMYCCIFSNKWEITNTNAALAENECLPQLFKLESAAVEDVAVEAVEGEVEYFNLQGVRVAEPAAGLYIRRQGNTVTKVLVK